MLGYIVKRVLWIIPVTMGVLLLVFTINHFSSGDPVLQIVGTNYTQEQYDEVEKRLGLDKPFFTQYFEYVWGIITRLDFGTSYFNLRPVRDEILGRVPTTLKFGLISVCITIAVGIPLGIVSATHQYSLTDYLATCASLAFAAIPAFWLALMFMLVFALNLKWLPATGIDSWKSWILPCLSLGLAPISSVTRMTRSSMLEVIRQDYIRTAMAKGVSERVVTYRHALKNALIPIITVIGMQGSRICGSCSRYGGRAYSYLV